MKRKKIGLFGGTFDPVHWGHFNLAFELMEKENLNEVWWIPAHINPFKVQHPLTSIEHRLEMVRLAIQGIPQFHLKDLEKNRPPPSYTLHTIKEFIAEQALNPFPHRFYLIMGEDAVPGFSRWHLPEEIIQLVPLLIGSRSGTWQGKLDDLSIPLREAIQKGLIQTRLMDISGTDIRQRLTQHLYCGHLLPLSVLEYIQKHQLYP